jgi:hypothetical protein
MGRSIYTWGWPKENFALYIRTYWPEDAVLNGTWTPPAVVKVK